MDKFDLKIGFCITSGISAALTLYLAFEEWRKYKKQKLKAAKKKLKLELLTKMNRTKEEGKELGDVDKSGGGE